MKKLRMLNIIDLEGTAWKDQTTPDGKQQHLVSEIIEIGIVQVDIRKLEVVKKKSYLIKPVNYPKLTKYCTDLTGITDEMLDEKGTSLEYAITRMTNEFSTLKYEWASWGDWDRSQLIRQCSELNIRYPFHKTHSNLKYWLAKMVGSKQQRNVEGMLSFFHMNFEGNEHRGMDDAYNVALMYIKLMDYIRNNINSNIVWGCWGDEYHKNMENGG